VVHLGAEELPAIKHPCSSVFIRVPVFGIRKPR